MIFLLRLLIRLAERFTEPLPATEWEAELEWKGYSIT
jgi:hypothetical protein